MTHVATIPSRPVRTLRPPRAFARLFDRAADVYRGWGTTPEERAEPWECQKYAPEPHNNFWRGIEINAPKEVVWRWLCQIRVAPYSYDWLDNAGRRGPRVLTPGAERLSVGQRINVIFRVLEFEEGTQITMRTAPVHRRFWADVTCTLKVVDNGRGGTRLLLGVTVHSKPGRIAGPTGLYELRKFLFPWGELVMVRKQFMTVAQLAEEQARHIVPGA